jgi:hypothetical protein
VEFSERRVRGEVEEAGCDPFLRAVAGAAL